MLRAILAFELIQRLRRLSTYVYFAVFFGFAFLLVIAFGGALKEVAIGFGGGEKVLVNSPYSLATYIGLLSYFGLPVTAAIMGRAVQQDFEYEVHPLFFTAPISKLQYLGGRFLGAFFVLVLIFSSIPAGALLASWMPVLDPARVGPTRIVAYIEPFLFLVVPNLLFTGAIFFIMAALLRKILPVFLTAVIALLGYLIALSLASEIENKLLASLLDPFGQLAFGHLTEYWSVFERNSRMIPFAGALLANRLIWSGVAALLFALAYRRFAFAHAAPARRRSAGAKSSLPERAPDLPGKTAIASTSFSRSAAWGLFLRSSWLQLVETVKNVYFAVIVAAGVLFMVVAAYSINRIFGTPTYPVTYLMAETVGGSFFLFYFIIIAFYSGELVWRERDSKVAQIVDASPAPTWLFFASKLAALIGVQILLCAVVMLCGMGIQAFKGYYHFEPTVYFKQLFVLNLARLCLISVLAMTIHVLVNNKYMGHFILVVYYAVSRFASTLGFEHHLYNFPTTPPARYSDMNGFGPFVQPILWFDLYWAALAGVMAVVCNLFWVRGMEISSGLRWKLARSRLTVRNRLAIGIASAAFVAIGGYIFHNTNRLNPYRTSYQNAELQAQYEKQHKAQMWQPSPRVISAAVAVDIFPEARRAEIRGTYEIENKTDRPCNSVMVNLPSEVLVRSLRLDGESRKTDHAALGVYQLELARPLHPGQKSKLEFQLTYQRTGFANGDSGTYLVRNGTFLSSGFLPTLGYVERRELVLDDERKKHGLPPKERMPDVNDAEARRNNYLSSDADWIAFDATVSTSPDQIAIAPGYLEREWTEGGRRYFHYTMDVTILKFFSFLSARYEVRRDKWKDINIEILYHAGHEFDLDRMIRSVKQSLDYYTRNFGPYQFRQVRIVEFPRYETFAQAFPNTIPYSESLGFIAKVNDKDENDIDYPFYVTAHEVGHQWWGHQVIGGRVQGSTLLSETLAQYSALMVMKAEFGPHKMRRFLKYELDRYLIGRATEPKKELPLLRVEEQQYIHYRKGSLVMYALQDYIGEDNLNQALAAYVKRVGHQEPPYTNSVELLDLIRQVTPDDLKYVLEDMFENITLYENRAVKAVYDERPDGRFDVRLTTNAKKLRHDALGKPNEVPLHDLIDIGVLDEEGEALYLQKHVVDRREMEFNLIVDRRPAKAGIDPFNKLIDRKPDDNSIKVEKN